MRRVGRRLAGVAGVICAAAALIVCSPAAARADNFGRVRCDVNPSAPECTVTVVESAGGGSADSGQGPLVCRFGGQVVDCHNDFGWLGAGGCYFGKDPGGFLPAQEWIVRCIDPASGDVHEVGVVLLLDPPATLTAMVRRAVSQLRIPAPVIDASPAVTAPQVVQVPVWWWVQPGVWGPRAATASLPGIAITATATPATVTWDAGDGTTTVCAGPGTAWTARDAPTAASPTCGHTYTTTSRTAPAGRFAVRAAVTWSIDWSGAGMTGTEPAVTTTATASVEVTELRAVVTR